MDKKRLDGLKKLLSSLPEDKLLTAIRGMMDAEAEAPSKPTRPVPGPKQ